MLATTAVNLLSLKHLPPVGRAREGASQQAGYPCRPESVTGCFCISLAPVKAKER
jgi:hypothetical protein